MQLVEFLAHSDVIAFSVAIMVVLIIGLIEGLGLLLGFALSGLLDNLIPELDIDVDAPELEHGAFSEFLTWMRFREVPVIIILLSFLISFGVAGLAGQQAIHSVFGGFLPWAIAVPAVVFASLPIMRIFIGILSKIMPRDETTAIKTDSLIGHVATITIGTAAFDSPAQAKLKDKHGQTHYVMVEPDLSGLIFQQGEQVLLVRREGALFRVITPKSENLAQ